MVSVIKDVSGFYVIKLEDRIVHHGREVAVLYTYNSTEKTGGMQKYGDPDFCEKRAAEFRAMHNAHPDLFKDDAVFVIRSSEIHPYHVQRIIDTSGWVGLWHRAYVLEEPEARAKIEEMTDTEEARALDHYRVDYVSPV